MKRETRSRSWFLTISLLTVVICLLASGCSTTQQLLAPFPEAPQELVSRQYQLQTLPPAENDKAPVDVTEATKVIVGNYTQCRAAISDLQGLREWVKAQRRLYLELCKQRDVDCNKGSLQR